MSCRVSRTSRIWREELKEWAILPLPLGEGRGEGLGANKILIDCR